MEVEVEEPSWCCRQVAQLRRWPLVAAWLATGLALALALAPEGPYDPRLAVLTATLVAVIWYAYFTFRAGTPPARVALNLNPGRGNPRGIYPEVKNLTDRHLHARIFVRVWVGDDPFTTLEAVFQGKRWLLIEGGRAKGNAIDLDPHLDWAEPEEPGSLRQEVYVAFKAEWIDSLCERGEHTTLYWRLDGESARWIPVEDPGKKQAIFVPLDDPYEDQPE